jgi:phosphoribosylanthranilate isomerase
MNKMSPLLKYCGNHSLTDIELSLKGRANYIGVVFAESKRKVTPCDVNEWLASVAWKPEKKLVGLFVNEEIEEIERVQTIVSLDVIQCHGNESVGYIKELKETIDLPIWKVIHHTEGAWETMEDYAPFVDSFVVDSKVRGEWGGTGTSFDWSHIPNYLQVGRKLNKTVFIAGGINPHNVGDLLAYHPDGIDLSSGIEIDGTKSEVEMKQLEEGIDKYESST